MRGERPSVPAGDWGGSRGQKVLAKWGQEWQWTAPEEMPLLSGQFVSGKEYYLQNQWGKD